MLKVKSLISLLNKKKAGQVNICLTTFAKRLLLIVAVVLTTTGCEKSVSGNDFASIESVLESVPFNELDGNAGKTSAPKMYPSCLVDLGGYSIGEEKKVIFVGNSIPSEYEVIDAKTGESVYSSNVQYNGKYAYGDFSEIDKPGKYYILADTVGQSYRFDIGNNIYEKTVNGILMEIDSYKWDDSYSPKSVDISGGYNTETADNPGKSTITGSKVVLNLIVAMELRKDLLEKEDMYSAINYECLWLAKMQDESGGVAAGVFAGNIEDISYEATAYFGAALGAFSEIYRAKDQATADRYLYQAEAACEYLRKEKASGKLSNELWFLINAALYRTTGKTIYKNEIATYYNSAEFYGSYFLLTTPKTADAEVCFELMDRLIVKASNISGESAKTELLIRDADSLYEDMMVVAFVNSTITNREYRRVLQNGIHYIDGRNYKSTYIRNESIYEKSMQLILYSNANVRLDM